MTEASKSLRAVRLGPFELLLETLELRKQGTPLKFAGHANQILAELTPTQAN